MIKAQVIFALFTFSIAYEVEKPKEPENLAGCSVELGSHFFNLAGLSKTE